MVGAVARDWCGRLQGQGLGAVVLLGRLDFDATERQFDPDKEIGVCV